VSQADIELVRRGLDAFATGGAAFEAAGLPE
jgi:hypothetical protein